MVSKRHPIYLLNTHYKCGLFLQFILSDFLAIYTQIEKAKKLNKKTQGSSSIKEQEMVLSKLKGPSNESIRIGSTSQDMSLLGQLKNHCSLLTQQMRESEEEVKLLQKTVNMAWTLYLQWTNMQYSASRSYDDVTKIISKISACMKKVARIIVPLITHYKDDENVLYFLMRHRKEMDTIYKTPMTLKIFQTMFPKGLEEAKDFMKKRYSRRGFHHLLPAIESSLYQIENDALAKT